MGIKILSAGRQEILQSQNQHELQSRHGVDDRQTRSVVFEEKDFLPEKALPVNPNQRSQHWSTPRGTEAEEEPQALRPVEACQTKLPVLPQWLRHVREDPLQQVSKGPQWEPERD